MCQCSCWPYSTLVNARASLVWISALCAHALLATPVEDSRPLLGMQASAFPSFNGDWSTDLRTESRELQNIAQKTLRERRTPDLLKEVASSHSSRHPTKMASIFDHMEKSFFGRFKEVLELILPCVPAGTFFLPLVAVRWRALIANAGLSLASAGRVHVLAPAPTCR